MEFIVHCQDRPGVSSNLIDSEYNPKKLLKPRMARSICILSNATSKDVNAKWRKGRGALRLDF